MNSFSVWKLKALGELFRKLMQLDCISLWRGFSKFSGFFALSKVTVNVTLKQIPMFFPKWSLIKILLSVAIKNTTKSGFLE